MKLLISLVLALTVQGEVFEPASESSTTPEIAEKSAKGEDEENHLHDLIANPEDEADEAVKNLKPEALEGAKATTEMAGGVGAAVLGEKLKSLRGGSTCQPGGLLLLTSRTPWWTPWWTSWTTWMASLMNLDLFSGRLNEFWRVVVCT